MSNLIFKEELNLSYKGARDYVYASDLFDLTIESILHRNVGEIAHIDYSVHRLLRNKVVLSLYTVDEDEIIEEVADARINFIVGKTNYVGLLNESNSSVTERSTYLEEDIFENSSINREDQSIALNEHYTDYTNLDVFTSMNKKLLTVLRDDIKGKWVSVRLQADKLEDLKANRKKLKVILRKVFSNKYTKSDLYNGDQKVGTLFFSII